MPLDPLSVIRRFYQQETPLYDTLVQHSIAVKNLALRIAQAHAEFKPDLQFIAEAAMLHDIGICKTDAPGIHCHGTLPYICHGIQGRSMLDELQLPLHALVCERHTGSGLTKRYIIEANLPLPHRDMIPLSVEEKIVCYADKFFSKSRELSKQKTFADALRSVSKFGDDSRDRFLSLHSLLKIPDTEA